MIRQILSLAVLFGVIAFSVALYQFSNAYLLLRTAYFDAQTEASVWTLLQSEAVYWAPFFAVGVAAGWLVNWSARKWAGTKQLGDGVVTDRFGVTFKMIDNSFDHTPVFHTLPITTAGLLPLLSQAELNDCTELEKEILGAIHASGAPADVCDAHGVDLYTHTVNAWRIAHQKESGDTLVQIAAVLHDAGKVLCYKRVGDAWVKTKQDHESLTNEFLRRLPNYIAMQLTDRRYINTLAAALAAARTDGYPVEIAEAVTKTRMYDCIATGQEKSAVNQALRDGEVDFADLLIATRRALRLPDVFDKLNINRNARSAASVKAYYDQATEILVIQAQALRELIAPHVTDHNRAALSLRQPTQGFHPSYSYISASLQQQQALITTIGLQDTPSGLWALRSGQTSWSHCYIVDAKPLGHAVALWGKSAQEYTLLPVTI